MANEVVETGSAGLSDNEKMLSALGYVVICCALPLFLVPMLALKESRFARFHARQGAALYIVAIGGAIIAFVVTTVLQIGGSMIRFPYLGCLGQLLQLLVGGGAFVLMIIGAINAMQGQEKELPVLGPLAAKLPF